MVDFVNNVNPSDYAIYNNVNKSEIEKEHEGNSKFVNAVFRKFLPTWQPATFLHPFTPTYVGVESQASYNIGLEIKSKVVFPSALGKSGDFANAFFRRRFPTGDSLRGWHRLIFRSASAQSEYNCILRRWNVIRHRRIAADCFISALSDGS